MGGGEAFRRRAELASVAGVAGLRGTCLWNQGQQWAAVYLNAGVLLSPPPTRRCGYQSRGWEVMYNGHTGRQLQAQIFLNPTYYQRLKHMVDDKIHSRWACLCGRHPAAVAGLGENVAKPTHPRMPLPATELSQETAGSQSSWAFASGATPRTRCAARLQGAGAGADTHAAAGGGTRARRRAAVWRDGARLHHLPRLRLFPQGVAGGLGVAALGVAS